MKPRRTDTRPCAAARPERVPYESGIIPPTLFQRADARFAVRPHRHRLHHGVRHPAPHQLRPRDILMLGAYFVFYGTTLFCLPWPAAVVVSILGSAALGVLMTKSPTAPARRSAHFRAHQRHRRFLLPRKSGPWWSSPVLPRPPPPPPVHQPEWLISIITIGGARSCPSPSSCPA